MRGSADEGQPLPAHVLGLCQRCGLVGLRVFPSIVVWGPLLLSPHFHDWLLGLVFPVERMAGSIPGCWGREGAPGEASHGSWHPGLAQSWRGGGWRISSQAQVPEPQLPLVLAV